MTALARLGGEAWFRLADKDLATHVVRTRLLAGGETLSRVTATLCQAYGVNHDIVPMTDGSVRTIVHSDAGSLDFQDYFVRLECEVVVRALEYAGASTAEPSTGFQ